MLGLQHKGENKQNWPLFSLRSSYQTIRSSEAMKNVGKGADGMDQILCAVGACTGQHLMGNSIGIHTLPAATS